MSVVSLSLTHIYKPDYDYENHRPGYKFDIEIKEQITELNVNGCIARFLQQQKRRNHQDEKLWDANVNQFGNWTKELFETAAKIAISDLRDFLRENGVFVYKKQRASIAGELAKTASEEEAQHK